MKKLHLFEIHILHLCSRGLVLSVATSILLMGTPAYAQAPVSAPVAATAAGVSTPTQYRFDFGNGKVAPGYTQVSAGTLYSKETGYGFEPRATIQEIDRGGDALKGDFITSNQSMKFSVALPEGNYKVTVTLGDASGESVTTVRAETRRLMLEGITTAKGKFITRTFLVNTRTPKMSPGNSIKLDTREWNAQTNQAVTYTWDDKLTLDFSGSRPCVCAVEIVPVDSAITVFLMGDSTVTDQSGESIGCWGQQLPRWFDAPVVIANHAESGETIKAFRFQRRWDKVMETIKPGDYVLMQFGHNDMKKTGHDGIWPADDKEGDWALTHSDANTDFIWMLATNAVEIRRRGGIPVIVSPSTRLDKGTGLANPSAMGEYPKAAQEAARLVGCAFIDLTALSIEVTKGLGTALAPKAYSDGVHTTPYGGYLYARCIVEGLKKANLDLVKYLTSDAGTFDPAHPKPLPDEFATTSVPLAQGSRPQNAVPQGPIPEGN